jgi:4-hydroxybenzoyl-CoA reductase subunit beta
VQILAGGTDLVPNMKHELFTPKLVLSLARIPELTGIRVEPDGTLVIGAMTRLDEVARDERVRAQAPALAQAAGLVAGPQLRRMGTLGGNVMLDTRCFFFNQSPLWRESRNFCLKAEGGHCLVVPSSNDHCYATYSGEMAAPLLVLGADLLFLGPDGERRAELDGFFVDDGILRFRDRRAAELLVGVEIPADATELLAGYMKLRIRDSIDFPSLGVAVGLAVDPAGRLERLRVATTAVASRPELLDDVTAPFLGRPASAGLAREIAEAAMRASTPYKNVPLEPKYRKKMVAVFVRRLLQRLHASFRGEAAP